MSYDFRLCLPVSGRDPLEVALLDIDERASQPEDSARNHRVASALRALHADFEPKDHEADTTGADLELTDPATGIQIRLFSHEAGLTIPYHHAGEKARGALAFARSCLATMAREGGYFVCDAQLGGIFDPGLDSDEAEMLAAYEDGVRRFRRRRVEPVAPPLPGLFPNSLGRAAYLLRWIGSLLLTVGTMYAMIRITAGTRWETLAVSPLPAWFLFKLLVLDAARLRDMGREPRGTLLSLLGPMAVYMQFWLFLGASSARRAVPRHPAGDAEPDAGRLYPYLVPPEYLRYGASDPAVPAWPVGHGLHLELWYDLEGLLRNVQGSDLARLGLSGEAALGRARENLDRLLASGRVRETHHATPEGDPFLVLDGHWAAATALVWPGLTGLGEKLPGDGPLLAGVPHRDALCLFRGGDAGRVARLRALIREQRSRGRKPLTEALFEITPRGVREADG
jgi:hypothetical protein